MQVLKQRAPGRCRDANAARRASRPDAFAGGSLGREPSLLLAATLLRLRRVDPEEKERENEWEPFGVAYRAEEYGKSRFALDQPRNAESANRFRATRLT